MDVFEKLTDEELEDVSAGTTVDYTFFSYCPYHLCEHAGIQKIKENFCIKGGTFPAYYCQDAKRYFFEAKNGYFDTNGNMLVQKC